MSSKFLSDSVFSFFVHYFTLPIYFAFDRKEKDKVISLLCCMEKKINNFSFQKKENKLLVTFYKDPGIEFAKKINIFSLHNLYLCFVEKDEKCWIIAETFMPYYINLFLRDILTRENINIYDPKWMEEIQWSFFFKINPYIKLYSNTMIHIYYKILNDKNYEFSIEINVLPIIFRLKTFEIATEKINATSYLRYILTFQKPLKYITLPISDVENILMDFFWPNWHVNMVYKIISKNWNSHNAWSLCKIKNCCESVKKYRNSVETFYCMGGEISDRYPYRDDMLGGGILFGEFCKGPELSLIYNIINRKEHLACDIRGNNTYHFTRACIGTWQLEAFRYSLACNNIIIS